MSRRREVCYRLRVSVLFTGVAVAGLYATAVVGLHRWNLRRLRRSGGLACLSRVDWDALLAGLDLKNAAVMGDVTGGDGAWLETLALFHRDPDAALRKLEAAHPASAQELYLREYLRLTRTTTAMNLELQIFASKRRIAVALSRFGDAPCLYFVRAMASSMVGLNRQAIDDLARAVYFSHQHPFYVQAVLDSPTIAEARPALAFLCRQAMDAKAADGEPLGR